MIISAFVKVPIYLSSRYVYFYGTEGQEQTRVVDIVAKEPKPLKIVPGQFTLGDKVSYRIDELEKGKKFRLTFTSQSISPGSYYGYLKLKTNYQEKPEITIRIRGRILKKPAPSKILPSTPSHIGNTK